MSLIIAYIGKKGCLMTGDKRKIGYFGDKQNLEVLEKELYEGNISSDDDFLNRSNELGISIKITDDANKLKIVGNTVRGEVSTKGTFETKRRRIYGTTNGYQILELLGSEQKSRKAGEKGIIIFGNNYAKQLAQELIQKKWKASQSLKYMGEVFEEILAEVSSKTPTVGDKFDTLIQQPDYNPSETQKHLNIVMRDSFKMFERKIENLTVAVSLFAKKIKEYAKVIGIFQTCLRACSRFNPQEVVLAKRGEFFEKLRNLINVVNITCCIVVSILHNFIILR